jgi:hypothetical protein
MVIPFLGKSLYISTDAKRKSTIVGSHQSILLKSEPTCIKLDVGVVATHLRPTTLTCTVKDASTGEEGDQCSIFEVRVIHEIAITIRSHHDNRVRVRFSNVIVIPWGDNSTVEDDVHQKEFRKVVAYPRARKHLIH